MSLCSVNTRSRSFRPEIWFEMTDRSSSNFVSVTFFSVCRVSWTSRSRLVAFAGRGSPSPPRDHPPTHNRTVVMPGSRWGRKPVGSGRR